MGGLVDCAVSVFVNFVERRVSGAFVAMA